MITEFIVSAGERTKRLDAFLVSHERGVSRSTVQRLIMAGRIRVNSVVVKPSQKIKPGDEITLDKPEAGPLLVNNEPVPLDLLYEDEVLLVVNKPPGVVVHPASGNWKGTLLNGLLAHFQATEKGDGWNNADIVPGLVHRLDKATSGLMVVAKTDQAHRALSSQFEQHSITRTYEALIYGRMPDESGMIDLGIGRDVSDGKKVSSNSLKPQAAVTEFIVLRQFGTVASHIELTPHTGRQHQLRVHVASLGCPILGDQVYGGEKVCRIRGKTIPRVMLHASRLGFQHPLVQSFQEYTVPFPSDMRLIYQGLQNESCG